MIALSCVTLAHGYEPGPDGLGHGHGHKYQLMLIHSESLERELENPPLSADEQRVLLRSFIKTAMMILRDDRPFDSKNNIFGINVQTWTLPPGKGLHFYYKHPTFRASLLHSTVTEFLTRDDPGDYSDDRSNAKTVPDRMSIFPSPDVAGLPIEKIKSLLQLNNYWINFHGDRVIENKKRWRTPEAPDLQRFYYRSKDVPGSKFPVNVMIFYFNPKDGSTPPMLSSISIERAYKILPPEERKQRRLEQQRANRQKYSKMPRVPETTTQPTSPPM